MGEIVGTGAAGLIAGGILSKEIIVKLLGPTADYLGSDIKNFVEKRTQTLHKIFSNALSKSDSLDETTAVPPKVLRDVINDGSLNDDVVSVEYFGGVLASSKSGITRDDRASTITGTLSRLSTYQIRSHYVIYKIIRDIFLKNKFNINVPEGRTAARVFIPYEIYHHAMDLNEEEIKKFYEILTHCMFGLAREELIDPQFDFGGKQHMIDKGVTNPPETGGLIVGPSVLGAEMFIRAHGATEADPNSFLSDAVKFKPLPDVIIPLGARKLHPTTT